MIVNNSIQATYGTSFNDIAKQREEYQKALEAEQAKTYSDLGIDITNSNQLDPSAVKEFEKRMLASDAYKNMSSFEPTYSKAMSEREQQQQILNSNFPVYRDMTQRPMPFSGLASLTNLPMFQEFATKLESEHPEASQLFSQMFMGSFQRPMPSQNPFMGMGMGMGSFHPMMGMGMGGYSPFMGMNPMMGMSGGGLGSFYPQPSTYGPPQSMPSMGGYPTPPQSSPFGGAMRGYYA